MQNLVLKHGSFPADIFDHIREGYRFVAARSRHVHIRDDRLAEYALSLQPRPPANTLDENHHYVTADREALAAYIMSLEAVNFGSGYEEALVAEGWSRLDNSLYFTVSTALKRHFMERGPWSAARMRRLDAQDIRTIFHLPDARFGRALAVELTASLNELGAFIEDGYAGSFMAMIDEADGHAARFVTRLAMIPGFQDTHHYQGRAVSIFKRAQITAADLQLAFGRLGEYLFGDIERLTMFADNGVPHVLRMDGILEYAPELVARIDAGAFIPAGSEEEIEIRCCGAEAVERLAALKGLRVVDLDHILWHRSVEDPKYQAVFAHRTLTRFY